MECNKFIEFKRDIGINDILRYKHISGVWALLGECERGWEWITVAATMDIGEEISEDILFMMKDISKRGIEKSYTNFWDEELFKFRIFNREMLTRKGYYLARRKALWAHIASVYDNFSFVCLVENESDKNLRFSKERYIAIQTKAKYWNDVKKSYENVQYKELDEIINSINEKYNIRIDRV